MLRHSIIKAMVCGLIVMLMASSITAGVLETKHQKVEKNTAYENGNNYPVVGIICVNWGGRLLTRPHGTLGYPADRNYSFPVHNGSVQLGFTIKCYVETDDIIFPIPHISFFFAEICDHSGVVQGKAFMLNSMKTKGRLNFSMTLFSKSIPADVGDMENFTVTIDGRGIPPLLSLLTWGGVSYQIWISYTEER